MSMQTIKGCEKFTELMDFRGAAFLGWLTLRLKADLSLHLTWQALQEKSNRPIICLKNDLIDFFLSFFVCYDWT